MRYLITLVLIVCFIASCSNEKIQEKSDFVVANGQMPDVVKDKDNHIHLVYGRGDTMLYTFSTNNASTFSKPSVITTLPHVFTFAMRGPQIAATEKGLVVTACTSLGDIYSFHKEQGGNWVAGKRVNDVDTIAKEGLMGLSADGENVFAVWLDSRGNKGTKIYSARSNDAGKIWSENKMIYTSPDSTVCECCKPSVITQGNNVYVMFRNWLQGNRDLYLIQSTDGGKNFGQAKKLGNGNWKLNGCPMDGGGLTVNEIGEVQTVWRREGKIFAAIPEHPEKEIGEGRGCTIETVNNKNVYAWIEKGEVIIVGPNGQKRILGKGGQPVLKGLDNEHLLCVWENEKQIHASVLEL